MKTAQTSVDDAIDSLRATFGEEKVTVLDSDPNGAWVRIDDVPLGPLYAQAHTFVIAHLATTLPFADVYPIFVRPDLARSDGQGLQAPVTGGHTAGPSGSTVAVVQISRRTRGDASQQTAGQKVQKVLTWLREQP